MGPSGGGKSTLCQLMPRFYDVDSGTVSVDGQDVRRVTQQSLRRTIGIVQQDVFLFADTIRENIRYGKPDATDAEVEEAATPGGDLRRHCSHARRLRHLCGRAGHPAVRRARSSG